MTFIKEVKIKNFKSILKLTLFACISLLTLNFIIRIMSIKYLIISDMQSGACDYAWWLYCASELAQKGYVDFYMQNYITNIHTYLQGCFFGFGFTLLAFIIFRLFGNIYPMFFVNFFVLIISVYIMYLILKKSSDNKLINSLILIVSCLNTYIFTFALKIRPDIFALFFALLSWYLIVKNRYVLAGFSFSISVYLFKFQMITWLLPLIFVLYKKEKSLRSIISFLLPMLSLFPFYLINFLYVKERFPGMVYHLSHSNTYGVFMNIKMILRSIINLTDIAFALFIVSPTGLLYFINSLPFQVIPERSLQMIFLLPYSIIYVYEKLRIFFPMVLISSVIQILTNLYFVYFDYYVAKSYEEKFYNKVLEISKTGVPICEKRPHTMMLDFIGYNVKSSRVWIYSGDFPAKCPNNSYILYVDKEYKIVYNGKIIYKSIHFPYGRDIIGDKMVELVKRVMKN
jgi:hypothetical protein